MRWTNTLRARRRPLFQLISRMGIASLLVVAGHAQAALGQAKATASADRSAVAAVSKTVQTMPGYDRIETTDANGTSVREFSARDGTVFAVDFSGPTMPDLKAVLGPYYDRYLTEATARRGSHHVVSVATDDVVISIVKLQRGFSGRAHLPAAVPAGVDVQSLR